jgi:hypothetical protein
MSVLCAQSQETLASMQDLTLQPQFLLNWEPMFWVRTGDFTCTFWITSQVTFVICNNNFKSFSYPVRCHWEHVPYSIVMKPTLGFVKNYSFFAFKLCNPWRIGFHHLSWFHLNQSCVGTLFWIYPRVRVYVKYLFIYPRVYIYIYSLIIVGSG